MEKLFNIKNEYLLIAGTLLLFIISYKLAFKKTIEAWQEHHQLQNELVKSSDVGYQPAYLERKQNNLSKIINLYHADTINFRSIIVGKIASIADGEHVKLSEVPIQDPFYHAATFTLQKLNFEGDYFSLLKVAQKLQTAQQIGVLRSLTFKSKEVNNAKPVKGLQMEVYLEVIK